MIRWTIPTTLFVGGTKYNTVPGLSKTVSQRPTEHEFDHKIRENDQNGYVWSYPPLCDLLWYTTTQLQRLIGQTPPQRLYSTANVQLVPIFSDFFQIIDSPGRVAQ